MKVKLVTQVFSHTLASHIENERKHGEYTPVLKISLGSVTLIFIKFLVRQLSFLMNDMAQILNPNFQTLSYDFIFASQIISIRYFVRYV